MYSVARIVWLCAVFVLVVPRCVWAQNTAWIDAVGTGISGVLELLMPALIALGVVYFVWGGIQLTRAQKDEERVRARTGMFWSTIALFAVVSVWGIVALVQEMTDIGSDKSVTAPGVDAQKK